MQTLELIPASPGSLEENPGLIRFLKGAFRYVITLLLLCGWSTLLRAQELSYAFTESPPEYSEGQTYSPSEQVLRPMQPLSAGQLEQTVAPIALYPDALVAQVLAASTYPREVAEANRWRQERANASPEQIAADVDVQAWDPSVKALTAFPQVLAQMDRNQEWTTNLGNAFYNQPQDVLEAVQVMRRRAQSAGNLESTPEEIVRSNANYIELTPANPQVAYVPAYNPWTIYGEPISPYPGFTLLGVLGEIFGATPLRYGLGIAMTAFTNAPWGWLAWGMNWLTHALLFDQSDYSSHSNTVADWGFRHTGFHAYAGRGGLGRSGFFQGGIHGAGRQRGAFTNGGWHSFAQRNTFAGNRIGRSHSFSRSNTFAGNWRQGSDGFHSFRGANGLNGRGFGNRVERTHTVYAANFHHERGGSFRESRGGNWSSEMSSGSHYGSSHGSVNRSGGSATQHSFGAGRSPKVFGRRNAGGFRSGGGGHAPKGFGGGKGFGGRNSGGGGHSSGRGGGGGSRHRR